MPSATLNEVSAQWCVFVSAVSEPQRALQNRIWWSKAALWTGHKCRNPHSEATICMKLVHCLKRGAHKELGANNKNNLLVTGSKSCQVTRLRSAKTNHTPPKKKEKKNFWYPMRGWEEFWFVWLHKSAQNPKTYQMNVYNGNLEMWSSRLILSNLKKEQPFETSCLFTFKTVISSVLNEENLLVFLVFNKLDMTKGRQTVGRVGRFGWIGLARCCKVIRWQADGGWLWLFSCFNWLAEGCCW